MRKSRGKNKAMKQTYVPWWLWEDYHAGMWRKLPKLQEQLTIQKAIEFTENTELYGMAMQIVVNEWPYTMLHNLSNTSVNKRAFLGHCAVCLETSIPEYITRLAWRELTEQQRIKADEIAEQTVNEWKKRYEIILKLGNKDVTQMASLMKSRTKFHNAPHLTKELQLQY